MDGLHGLFSNGVLGCALLSWAIAQFLKVLIDFVKNRSFDATRLIGTGGMPSSHTALVVALCGAIAAKAGYASPEFAIVSVFSAVVIYDATGIRRAAGKQAAALNKIIKEFTDGHPIKEVYLKELLGHTPLEVIGGAVVGIVVALAAQMWGWI